MRSTSGYFRMRRIAIARPVCTRIVARIQHVDNHFAQAVGCTVHLLSFWGTGGGRISPLFLSENVQSGGECIQLLIAQFDKKMPNDPV